VSSGNAKEFPATEDTEFTEEMQMPILSQNDFGVCSPPCATPVLFFVRQMTTEPPNANAKTLLFSHAMTHDPTSI